MIISSLNSQHKAYQHWIWKRCLCKVVCANRILFIVSPDSATARRIILDACDHGQLIDAAYGQRARAILIGDGGANKSAIITPTPATIGSTPTSP
ncbi:MAG: extracellular matrix/biofilm biosynthesis regulator RemA family protein [Cyanobacteria bacterium J06649_5]